MVLVEDTHSLIKLNFKYINHTHLKVTQIIILLTINFKNFEILDCGVER